jgi:catechol 2,3-dioxygenase-like lactoylglutathione lyase family enzyme
MYLRVARHTNNLEKIEDFYVNILGFQLLGVFQNHHKHDGLFIGKVGLDWHFEFTKSDKAGHQVFDQDDVIVLYPKTILDYNELVDRLEHHHISSITGPHNFWNESGKMFLDPDGYRIVLSPLKAVIDEIN